jgi:aryl-alcohol dehydrogenase-like predicted oxidoreductase
MAGRHRRLPRFSDRLALGRSGLKVSPFCLGMVEEPETIAAAFDAGINFFFLTADMHWPYYDASRRGLEQLFARHRSIRGQVVVAAACYPTQPEFSAMPFIEVVEATRGLDRMDVAVMGGVYASDFTSRHRVYLEHRRSRFAGIRAIGATFHDRVTAATPIVHGLIDIAFARYNPAHAGARADLFPALAGRAPTPLYIFNSTSGYVDAERMRALGVGRSKWRPHITDHYRFALTRPEVNGLLCAPRTPAQVEALGRALEAGPLDDDEETYLMDLASLDAGEAVLDRPRATRPSYKQARKS